MTLSAAGGAHVGPPVAEVLLGIALVVTAARLLGALLRRLGQPPVIGEILAGLLLGASVLGQVEVGGAPATDLLFPPDTVPYLTVLANLGLVIFMFIVGMELDLGLIRGNERRALVVSVSSVLIPLTLGALLGLLLHARHDAVDGAPVDRVAFALFLGASMAVTAFPLLARILSDRGMQRTPLGVIALAAAAVDDVIAWALLALVSAVAAQKSAPESGVPSLPIVVVASVVYVGVMFTLVRLLLRRLVPRYRRAGRLTPGLLAFLLVGLLLSAWTTEQIGIHFIFGAFVFGACLPREGTQAMFTEVLERLEQVSVLLLLPVFFIVTGLSVDVTSFGAATLGELVLVLLVAIGSKFGGAYVAGRLLAVPTRRAAALGLLMNTRGLTELVLLSVGQRLGVLDTQMFSMLVVMALVTTFMTTPLLRLVYPDRVLLREIAEGERAAAGDAGAYRVLVVVDDVEQGRYVVDTALDILGDEGPRGLLLVRLRGQRAAPLELGSGLTQQLAEIASMLDGTRELERRAEARGVPVTAVTRASEDVTRDVALLVAAHGVDVVVVPKAGPVDVARLVGHVDATVALWSGRTGASQGPADRGVLVPVQDVDDDTVLALAARVALGHRQRLHLVTDEGRPTPRRVEQLRSRFVRAGGDVFVGAWPGGLTGRLAVTSVPGSVAALPALASLQVVARPSRVDPELELVLAQHRDRSPAASAVEASSSTPAVIDLTDLEQRVAPQEQPGPRVP